MNTFTIFPAIDLQDGRCVRLRQGRAEDSTTYSDDPVGMAQHWAAEGATWLHVVDLDGAFQGQPAHRDLIRRIVQAVRIPVEVGGGLRTEADIEAALADGVQRVIVGTLAWEVPELMEHLVDRFGPRLAVGLDARDGRVQVKGWTETTDLSAADLARHADALGVQTIIYTDTATDGMLEGPNVGAVKKICASVACAVIASGGIRSADDLCALRALECPNLAGAIVGTALYEGHIALRDLEQTS
ncbi:MAG: 1-(5-phosphoribosyl)-5-[(5-phosphoribosylamino)methylideneamino]imidazole-4-carboxamide isomerase [Kiritimatiellaeota bacterium]|nr:1-(5-phosphoribosyl)-5-[(5-phosphoribosylamino)methylideneamino]imidazole-4-carboxamide isomerase [Kiritimatiellota bacterium]